MNNKTLYTIIAILVFTLTYAGFEIYNHKQEQKALRTQANRLERKIDRRNECVSDSEFLVERWIDAYNLMVDSYNEGYYYSYYQEGQLDVAIDTLNGKTSAWRSRCLNASGVKNG